MNLSFLLVACSSVLLLLSSSTTTTLVSVADTPCTLECNNRGVCKFGDADFSEFADGPDGVPYDFHQDTNQNGMYCECDSAWTGVNCDHSFQRCDDDKNKCFHKGECVRGTINSSGQVIHICDCRQALENEIHYIGLHCERESPENHPEGTIEGATICNNIGSEYCLNGGSCKPSGSALGAHGGSDICECPAHYTGRHCQLKKEALEVKTCAMQCLNGGQCIFGYRDKTEAEEAFDPDNALEDPGRPTTTPATAYQHCQCKDGFSGTHCEREHTKCGDKFCFHGSTCQEVQIPDALNPGATKTIHHCNCLAGKNNTHSFAGIHCEQHSTSFCGPNGGNGRFFCTNNGQCKDEGNGIYACTCEKSFRGPHCEFPSSVGISGEGGCVTDCQNGGKCAEGFKDHGLLHTMPDVEHLINATHNEHLEHCLCPTGFAGLHCEHKAETCPDGQHLCFHGGKCVANDSASTKKCICDNDSASSSQGAQYVAGQFCEHTAHSSNVCSTRDRVFCVNGGTCNADSKSCNCPTEFKGDHCEFTTAAFLEQQHSGDDDFVAILPENYDDDKNLTMFLIFGSVALVAILFILGAVVMTEQSEEVAVVAAPPRSLFPPAAAFQPGSATQDEQDHSMSSAEAADMNGSAIMEESPPAVDTQPSVELI